MTSLWAVSDGNAGNEIQALGLAEALGLAPRIVRLPAPRPRWLRAFDPLRPAAGFGLAPPWPGLVVSAGRRGAFAALAVRRQAGAGVRLVQILRPPVATGRFDLVITPRHDRLEGPNVLATRGALNRITPERLAEAGTTWSRRLPDLPRPLVAVLVGGGSGSVAVPEGAMAGLAVQLGAAMEAGAGLLVTTSRRTAPAGARLLAEALRGRPAHLWDGTGDNPYFGFLALADAVVVTADSVNMTSEAATTGKPVHVAHWAPLPDKFRRFHAALEAEGVTRRFDGRIGRWSYTPLDDTARAAEAVRAMLGGSVPG